MRRSLILLAAALFAVSAHGSEVRVAVAANFGAPMQDIAAQFEKQGGAKLVLVSGATGKFGAQIRNGAPFDVLLAADEQTPARLAQDGLAVEKSKFTYAIGKLALCSTQPMPGKTIGDALRQATFTRLAIANPKIAPYGAAAIDTLTALGLLDVVQPKLVQAENIAQAFQFLTTGNAQFGFVALSQVYEGDRHNCGSLWIVPPDLYRPLRQDAILLKQGAENPAAQALLHFLKSAAAAQLIRQYGYELPDARVK